MYVSNAIIGYLDFLRNERLSDFNLLDAYVEDETLNFMGRASQYITRTGVFQDFSKDIPETWAFIIFNRNSLTPSEVNRRNNTISTPSTYDPSKIGGTALFRMASLGINCKIVTNNMEMAEAMEEYLFVYGGENTVFEVDNGKYGKFKCSVTAEATTSFEKESTEETGSVIGVGFEATLQFPIIMPEKQASIIETINEKIWSINSNGEKGVILSEEIIK